MFSPTLSSAKHSQSVELKLGNTLKYANEPIRMSKTNNTQPYFVTRIVNVESSFFSSVIF